MAAPRSCPECHTRTPTARCPVCGTATVVLVSPEGGGMINRILEGKYKLLSVLGRGGMGTVFRAEDTNLGRAVAIKVISRVAAGEDVPVVKRFRQEARLSSRINHHNAITIFDSGVTEDGLMYLVMELLEGRELSKELKELGRLPMPRALAILTQVLKALNAAHTAGIVHRDMKPANVFLKRIPGEEEQVKVMDFGIAKALAGDGEGANLTQMGNIVGSPAYMSPEQVQGRPVDGRTDLYSTGVILFEMLCGTVPFHADSPTGVMFKQVMEPPPALDSLVPELHAPPELEALMRKLLAKDATQRPANALEAMALVQQVAATLLAKENAASRPPGEVFASSPAPPPETPPKGPTPPERRTPTPPERAVPLPGPELAAPAPAFLDEKTSSDGPLPPRSRLPQVAALVAGVLVLGGGVAWAVMQGGRAPVSPPAAAPAPAPVSVAAVEVVSAPPAPASVSVRVESVPPGAEVLQAGTLLGTTPLALTLPQAETPVTLEVRRTGFKTETRALTPRADQVLEVRLAAVPPPAAPRKPPPRKGPTKKSTSDADLLEDLQ